ncbi:hypothetical protein CEXT_118051 [Caerostris extrusa]|uniref:Uncharacterized protein n=1 Tax=Caerostris extrusa TaxID=172846 RepID=A0AAV4N9J1_CAEEX|nr:hypothetical protein CEXT_118051 [Caerostris extrusa]
MLKSKTCVTCFIITAIKWITQPHSIRERSNTDNEQAAPTNDLILKFLKGILFRRNFKDIITVEAFTHKTKGNHYFSLFTFLLSRNPIAETIAKQSDFKLSLRSGRFLCH